MRSYRWLFAVVGVALVGIVLVPLFSHGRDGPAPDVHGCLGKLYTVSMALRMYAADNGGYLPRSDRWVSCLVPAYIDKSYALKCPNDHSVGRSSYGMNGGLGASRIDDIRNPERAVLLYETARPRGNPSGGPDDVAAPPRHEWGNNYAYADGTVNIWREPPAFGVE